MGPPSAICFDYGHTLVDIARPTQAIAAAGPDLAAELDLAGSGWQGTAGEFALEVDRLVEELVGQGQHSDPGREVDFGAIQQESLARLLGSSPSPQLSSKVGAVLQRAWVAGVVPIEPAREVLAALQGRGMRLALCSNAPYPAELMQEQLGRLGLLRYFEVVLFSSEVGWRKPNPRIFTELLDRLGLVAERVWFVGDDWQADIEGAAASGMRAILAPGAVSREPGAEQLNKWADLIALLG